MAKDFWDSITTAEFGELLDKLTASVPDYFANTYAEPEFGWHRFANDQLSVFAKWFKSGDSHLENSEQTAKKSYGAYQNAETLVWLAGVLGEDDDVLNAATEAADAVEDFRTKAKKVRELIPFRRIAELVSEKLATAADEPKTAANPAGDQPSETDDVSSPDASGWARRHWRTSQTKFRALLFANYPNECCICGITESTVLEAAHLIAHSKGGTASLQNGRILCANHHSAFDAGLFEWNGTDFVWIGTKERPTGI